MSVMLEHQSVPQSPCTPDCPDRSGDCMLHCSHGYAAYRAARDNKVYAARAATAEASRIASAGKRQASVKKARMVHRHKR